MNFFFNFIKITFIIFLTSCSETRLATHITKQVLKDTGASDTKLKSDSGQKPIYKVGDPYFVNGIKYIPKEDNSYYEVGIASWYGPNFHGKLTANGEIFNQYDITAAHKTLPLPSIVKVINLENKREIISTLVENYLPVIAMGELTVLATWDDYKIKINNENLDNFLKE